MRNYIFSSIKKLRLKPFLSRNNSLKKEKIYDGVFYKVEKDGVYFYVGGSIHLGNIDKVIFNPAVERAYKESIKIAVELDTTKVKNIINFYKGLSNIPADSISLKADDFKADFLQPENKIKYENICKQLGLNFEKYSKLPYSYFYSVLQQNLLKKAGYKSSYGIDNIFIRRAKHDKKPVVSLETPSIQIDALISAANMSPETLGGDKIVSLEDLQISVESLSKMHDAIFEGDTLTLVNDILTYKPMNESDKDNLNRLLFKRNDRMASKIESLIGPKEIYFVIVGAAHVVGKGGLLKLFSDKGYRVSRLK